MCANLDFTQQTLEFFKKKKSVGDGAKTFINMCADSVKTVVRLQS